MAKKKNEGEENSVSDIETRLAKQFGDGVIKGASYILDKKDTIIPVSPMLDSILGGGIKFGSFVIPTGPPKVGKSSLSLDFCTTGLEIPYDLGPRKLYVFNIEGRLNKRDLLGIKKLAPYVENNRVVVIGSERGRILSGENYLDIGEQLINEKPGCMFLFDSFSQLCSKAGKEKEWDGTQFRDDVPKLLSQFCKRISNVIPINESIVIGITHQIANTGFGFSPWAEASGNKVQYAVDVKLKATHCKEWKSGETVIGQDVFWECYCSPLLNGPSETKCTSKLRYGYGIDKEAELVDLCVDLGLIKKGGAWYEMPDGTKLNGLEKVRDALVANPEIYKELNKNIRGMLDLPECM